MKTKHKKKLTVDAAAMEVDASGELVAHAVPAPPAKETPPKFFYEKEGITDFTGGGKSYQFDNFECECFRKQSHVTKFTDAVFAQPDSSYLHTTSVVATSPSS